MPLPSPAIAAKWFVLPDPMLLAPVPPFALLLFVIAGVAQCRLPPRLARGDKTGVWIPFAAGVGIFMLGFHGLTYSLFPWLVPQRMASGVSMDTGTGTVL